MTDSSDPPRVLVAGHACLDLTPQLDAVPGLRPGDLTSVGALRMSPGGCVANTGGDLAELGIVVSAAADIGDDELSASLIRMLADRGLDVGGFRRTSATTSYSVVIQPRGVDRTFWHHTGANAGFDGSLLELPDIDLLHLGYPPLLPALVADNGAPLHALLQRAVDRGIATSLDLAVVDRPDDASRAHWARVLGSCLPLTDVITPSMDDLISSLGEDAVAAGSHTPLPRHGDRPSAVEAAVALVARGAAIAVVSDGAHGLGMATASADRFARAGHAVAALDSTWHDVRLSIAASPVERTVTTTGTGDAATAGLLAGLLRGLGPVEAARYAADVAAARLSGRPLPREV